MAKGTKRNQEKKKFATDKQESHSAHLPSHSKILKEFKVKNEKGETEIYIIRVPNEQKIIDAKIEHQIKVENNSVNKLLDVIRPNLAKKPKSTRIKGNGKPYGEG